MQRFLFWCKGSFRFFCNQKFQQCVRKTIFWSTNNMTINQNVPKSDSRINEKSFFSSFFAAIDSLASISFLARFKMEQVSVFSLQTLLTSNHSPAPNLAKWEKWKNFSQKQTFPISMFEIIKASIKFMLYISISMHNLIKIFSRSSFPFGLLALLALFAKQKLLKNYLSSLN